MSLASQPSLHSLPSLDVHNLNTSPSLHQCITTIKGHFSSSSSAYVSALAVDGDSLYIASSDGSIRLWELDRARGNQEEQQDDDSCSGSSSTTVADTNSSVKSLLATCNGGLLLSSHQDGKIRAWRAGSRRRDGATRQLVLRAVLPTAVDRLRTCLLPWSYVEIRRHRRCTWVHHVDAVTALAVSPDGALLYSASWDRSIKVWRLPDFRCVESIAAAHDDAINALAVSPDGRVYTGSADKKIKAWTRGPGQKKHALVGTLERHRSAVNALALGANGKVLYSGACDRSIVVWESAADGRMEATGTLRGHARAILCLAAAGELVCSGSADRTVRVWRRGGAESSGYTCLAVMESHGAGVKSLALVRGRDDGSCSSEGSSALVCSGALDGDVKIWSVFILCL
uniref:Anaphase-promoting complex subunit 4 WD40 domain-containing protein n=1 Tax=Oryza punctata TaxID=4537 RepID=A0A0E0K0V3_ORYPU